MGRPRKNLPGRRPLGRRFPPQAVGSTRTALGKLNQHGGVLAGRAEVWACQCGLNPLSVWPDIYSELDEQIRSEEEALAS